MHEDAIVFSLFVNHYFLDPITLIGITGAAIILIAFVMNQLDMWKKEELRYDFANLLGSSLMIVYAALINSIPFLILNVVWAGVAFIDVVKYLIKRHS